MNAHMLDRVGFADNVRSVLLLLIMALCVLLLNKASNVYPAVVMAHMGFCARCDPIYCTDMKIDQLHP